MCRLKKHAYVGLPPSENHASQGKNVRTNTRNSAFPCALAPVTPSGSAHECVIKYEVDEARVQIKI